MSDNMSPRDKTKSNRTPGRDLNVVFAEKSGQNQVFRMATLAEYKTRNTFWAFLLSAYPGKKVLKMSTGIKQLRESSFNMTRGGDEDIETRSLKF